MSLVAWYPLNGDTLDYSGNGYNLTNNDVSFDVNGKIGNCCLFDGVYSKRLFVNNFPLMSKTFSWCFWLYKLSDTPSRQFYISHGRDVVNYGINVGCDGANSLKFWVGNNVFNISIDTLNKWTHVTMIGDGSKVKIYLNGIYNSEFVQTEINFTQIAGYSNSLVIGKMSYGYTSSTTYFASNAKINDVRLYNHVLSDKEILDISKAKILHYKFDSFEEPTTNLLVNGSFDGVVGWSLSTNGSGNFSVLNGMGKITINDVGKYYYLYQNKQISLQANQKVTLSAKFLNNVVGTFGIRLVMFNGSTVPAQPVSMITLDGTGGYRECSVTTSHGGVTTSMRLDILAGSYYGGMSDVTVYFKDVLCELKSYNTPFVDGDRSGEVYDYSGYGNHSILSIDSTPRWINENPVGVGSYKFNGSNSFIALGSKCKVTHQISICAWAYKSNWSSDSSSRRILSCTEGGGWQIGFNDIAGYVSIPMYKSGVGYINPFPKISRGEISNGWHHFVGTFDGRYCCIYMDGVLKDSVDTGSDGMIGYNSTNGIFIGAEATGSETIPSGGWWDGNVSDVRIYATALDSDYVSWLYKNRASLDNRGNLSTKVIKEIGINRCPNFDDWTLNSGARVENGVLYLDKGGSAVSPYILVGEGNGYRFDCEFYSDDESNNTTYKPKAGYLIGSKYFNSSYESVMASNNYSGNGKANTYSVGSWFLDSWSLPSGVDLKYLKITISQNDTWTGNTYRCKNPSVRIGSGSNKSYYSYYGSDTYDFNNIGNVGLLESGVYECDGVSEVGNVDGLVRWYKLEEDLYDYSMNVEDGVSSGTLSLENKDGYGCVKFGGGYIGCGQVYLGSSGTIACWVKSNREYPSDSTSTTWRGIVGKVDGGGVGQQSYYIDWYGSDTTRILRFGVGDSTKDSSVTVVRDLNEWTHICGVIEGGTIKFYVNGELVGSKSTSIICQDCTTQLKIGNFFNSFDGWIRDVRIYNRPLNLEEVVGIYKLNSGTSMQISSDKRVYVKNSIIEG